MMRPVKDGIDSISKYLRSKKEIGRRKIGLLVDGPNTVSYTHLDVYKRQVGKERQKYPSIY